MFLIDLSNNVNKDERNVQSANDQINKSILSLHPIEKKILAWLYAHKEKEWLNDEMLIKESGLSIDQIRRGIEWLKFKNFIKIEDSSDIKITLKDTNIFENNNFTLPERKLVNCVKKGFNTISNIINSEAFNHNNKEVFSAIKVGKNNSWISLENDSITLLPACESISNEEKFIEKLNKNESLLFSDLNNSEVASFDLLKKRPNLLDTKKIVNKKYHLTDLGILIYKKIIENSNNDNKNTSLANDRKFTVEHLIENRWKNIKFEQIDVEAPLPLISYGKKNPLIDFIDEVKEILVGMGFTEIEGNLIQTSFWNFDALFIPQDHSAREMQDTFFLSSNSQLKTNLPDNKIIENVSKIHEQNWHYKWSILESKPFVLRTHTTPVTIQHLASEKPDEDKVFLIGRVFRNEKPSFKHLVEFHQIEGIFTNKNANLRQLIGIQTEFYNRLGIKKIKFWPTFFPYTEPSLQSMIYNEKLDKWIELFGMGLFRPEVTQPLGIKNPVLAWGGGFERLAMLRFDLDDIRELYNNNLTWIKGVPKCLL